MIDAEIAVITPMDLDHTEYLGETVAAIAAEKTGIIKPGATAILAAQSPEAAAELLRRAATVETAVARKKLEFEILERRVAMGKQIVTLQKLSNIYDEIFLPLHGTHQTQNAACALAAVEAFFGLNGESGAIDTELVRAAFATTRSPKRLKAVRSAPTILLDAAHNPHKIAAAVAAIAKTFDFRRLISVVGVLGSKNVPNMLAALEPAINEIVITQTSSQRAMSADELAAHAVAVFDAERITIETRLNDTLETTVRLAEKTDDKMLAGVNMLITGSVVTADETRVLLKNKR